MLFGIINKVIFNELKIMNNKLTSEEQKQLENWITQMETIEMTQAQDLIDNCNVAYQFAKTHSVYVKDWEKTKQKLEENLRNGILSPGVSANLHKEIIDASDEMMQNKLKKFKMLFNTNLESQFLIT
ncbi:MAG TPA: hypothetical protein ENI76_07210 [Ignavibacteria bacterium]|nr:hypothetical protein [Ignavibacteria bacterium]